LRPDVVWFDEELDPGKVRRVQKFLARGDCDFVLVIGTTAAFSYITEWAVAGRGTNGRLIEINPAESAASPLADEIMRAPAATIAGTLVEMLVDRNRSRKPAPAGGRK
jgi:NAD-dependent SIR2 family protein deacetylase